MNPWNLNLIDYFYTWDLKGCYFSRTKSFITWILPFFIIIKALRREVMKNRPADLEDFVVAFCEARLQGRALPETTFGQNGGVDGVKLERKAIIKIMKKDTSTSDPLSRRGSSDGNAPFTGSLKRGSFSGTPLLDFGLQKRGSFSNGNLFVKGTSDPSILGAGESIISIRRDSNQSTVSSEDSSNDIWVNEMFVLNVIYALKYYQWKFSFKILEVPMIWWSWFR